MESIGIEYSGCDHIYDRAEDCGKGAEGKAAIERVLEMEKSATFRSEERDVEVLCGRLGEREPPIGTEINLSLGTFRYEKVFSRGGGYFTVLHNVDDDKHKLLACRGTAAKWNATGGFLSVLNNLQWEVGLNAVTSNWKELSAYLKEANVERLTIYGKSQGGAQAQMLAPLFKNVDKVITLASVGTSWSVHEQYEGLDIDVRGYYINGQKFEMDYVPYVGGHHVPGEFFSLSLHDSPSVGEEMVKNQWFFMRAVHFFASFGWAHTRQTTLVSYKKQVCDRKVPDPFLETSRKIIAFVLHIVTFVWMNPASYRSFVQEVTAIPAEAEVTDSERLETSAFVDSAMFFDVF